MFAYCCNNPTNRIDATGMFWEEVGDFFARAWDRIKTVVKNTFGAGASTTATISTAETAIIPDPSPITVESGAQATQIISEIGDTTKPISFYADKNVNNPVVSSSAGVNLNLGGVTLTFSIGLDNIGVFSSINKGDQVETSGLRVNLSKLKVGLEHLLTIRTNDIINTTYTNVSINGWPIIAAYGFLITGQYMLSPTWAR